MSLKYSDVPELSNIGLTCKALRWTVATQLKSRMEMALFAGHGALLLERSMNRTLVLEHKSARRVLGE